MSDYLKRQLIAYLGNKRSLLGFFSDLFRSLTPDPARPGRFLDAFAGSGAVARLARSLGYEVHANDWEPYAEVVNRAYLTLTPVSLQAAFAPWGGFTAVQARLNTLTRPQGEEFIARHYAPARTDAAQWRTERLFYTRENALWLDAVRQELDNVWPAESPAAAPARTVLLALLVYEASVHSNTSGVFKAYHKGYGGHSGDALTRILAPMALEEPVLCDSPRPAAATALDAADFLRSRPADLIYLDPPYNQHQYGSNYHLLNTVVRGDRFEPPGKAGIRPDWGATRSPYCNRRLASAALSGLLAQADARHLVISYNTEGLVPFDELYDLLSARGEVRLAVADYVTYRGGRQSPGRRNHNLEFALVVDTHRPAGSGNRTQVDRFRRERRLATLLKGSFHPGRLRTAFQGRGQDLELGGQVWTTDDLHRITGTPEPAALSDEALSEALAGLEAALCRDHTEEFAVLLGLLDRGEDPRQTRLRTRRLAAVLRKFTFRQYRADYEQAWHQARRSAERRGDPLLLRLTDDLALLARRRFAPR